MGTTEPRPVFPATALGICGKTASGKSSLVRALAQVPGSKVVSFGDYVRRVAEERGLQTDRYALQVLGDQLLVELGAESFLTNVTRASATGANPSGLCLFDGVRHEAVWTAISDLFASSLLAGVACNDAERARRLKLRDELTDSEVQLVLNHPMDKAVDHLLLRSDVLLRSDSLSVELFEKLGRSLGEILVASTSANRTASHVGR